jgi:hypothetical protein
MSFETLKKDFETGHGRWHLRCSQLGLGLASYGFYFFSSNLEWLFSLSFFAFFFKLMMCHMVIECCM